MTSDHMDAHAGLELDLYTGHDRTPVRVLRDQVARAPDAVLLQSADATYTRAEVDRITNKLARGLRDAGVAEGDRVLLLQGNSPFYVFCWLALAKLGAIEVPINTQYRGEMMTHVASTSRATMAMADPTFAENLAPVLGAESALDRLVLTSGTSVPAPVDGTGVETLFADDLLASDDGDLGTDPSYRSPMALMYTSGTTGPSKGVLVSNAHAFEYANGCRQSIELREGDVYFGALPLFHIAGRWGVIYASLMSGASAVITPRFSATTFWEEAASYEATTTFLLGAMANFLHQQPAAALDRQTTIERMLIAPLVPDLEAFRERFDVKVSTAFASTESNLSILSDFSISDYRQCGRARPGWEVAIVDDHDERLGPNEPGGLVVRPPQPWLTMLEYLDNPAATAEIYRNCWMHTGDMAYRDEDGNFYFVDRMSDAIRRRGENISSFEVEREVNAHPDILESAAIGVASEHTEEDLMVVAVQAPKATVTPEDLHAFLVERAPRFMVPRYVEIVDELPKTPTEKIQKSVLRERGTAAAWQPEGVR
jgi:crotonobetaine/carnitine-CoA ligase